MKIILHILLFLILFIAANALISCSRKSVSSSSQVKDSIHIEYKERLVEIPIPGDTVTIEKETFIECDSITNKPKPITIQKKKGRAQLTLKVDAKGKLTGDCTCDSLKRIIRLADKEIFRLRERIEQKNTATIQYKTRTIDLIGRWIMALLVILLAGRIFLKVKGIWP